ncbi:DUF6348 family protein [uncultured Tenacibaculum sp.]|uniref:DUF6348 family protein n=1 Tax=uncultured Tenacibaculum sp. TaxID=174713 RepID=UPI0026267BFF|nr:DUF6348 family protein [uncultured Tenacibaculum sp.]
MGIFNFLKSKKKEEPIDINSYLLLKLKERIEVGGHTVVFSTEYAGLIVNSEIEIATAVIPGDFHSSILPLLTVTIHKDYFPEGIQSSLMGAGITAEEKVESAIDNYISTTYSTIIDSFNDTHSEEFDFTSILNHREVLWHPKMSNEFFQGNWNETEDQTSLYSIIENEVKNNLLDNKFNWLKLYISRQPNGEISGECLLNNDVWEKGYYLLEAYAKTWKNDCEFLGQKQFIMFRRCDLYDKNI